MKNASQNSRPRLAVRGISKCFGQTQALSAVSLEFRSGEVHALLGENGAGKSTLVKILSGALTADAGQVELDGHDYSPRDPHDAHRRGVAMVYQELALIPDLTVEANIFLGQEQSAWGIVRRREQRRIVEKLLTELQHPEIDPDVTIRYLSPGAQQLVEIARALVVDARVLVLDEPTSSLTRGDVERLFSLIRRLSQKGVSVVYISHFLEEVEEIADRFSVLRDGRLAGGGATREFTRDRIIELMVGRSVAAQYPRIPHEIRAPVLQLRELSGTRSPRDISLTLHEGEILGIAGIVGAGRTELVRTIFGLSPARQGAVNVKSVPRTRTTPRQRISQGVGYLSENRREEGLAVDQSIADNMTYSRLRPFQRFGWLSLRRRRKAVCEWIERLGIRCRGPDQPVRELSGGNQQKVALARLLHQRADILLLDEPTRGIDVGSKAEIYQLIGQLAAQGKAIIFISSYLPELLGVCDRLAVMSRGRLSAIRAVHDWSADEIIAHAMGAALAQN
jgi:ribose transport system ATP-binding protein